MKTKSLSTRNKLGSHRSLLLIWLILPVIFLGIVSNLSSVNASSGGDVNCYDRGIIDGEDHPFNQGTYDKCGDDYYQGFIKGCLSVEGNVEIFAKVPLMLNAN
ncbi:hypothetical protein [Candidatus Nitrosocosmicus hydrocola]|uniref:hypothetical protein n=1 Tax=Candidatus Nitrosocosmicus hydrocola TaxID=1826872 RepID=UPI0011E5C000|nr:hypothetical protein [Candidatus Nitrosocosmicus hydrocola]